MGSRALDGLRNVSRPAVIGVDAFFRSIDLMEYEDWEIVDFDRLHTDVVLPFYNNRNPLRFLEMNWRSAPCGAL